MVDSTNQTLSSLTGDVTLSCSFTSDDSGLNVVWLRDNVALSSSSRYLINSINDGPNGIFSNLTVINVNITDAGSYICRATDQSQVSRETIVSIFGK